MDLYKIFGMFDRIDDIVYEPIKLVCDALRQPLKQIEVNNEKSKAEHKQTLEIKLKQFEADLEQEKKDREMNRTIDERRLSEEINQMIIDNDLARREKMIQLEIKYRKEMALAAAELEKIILNISTENRDIIFKLYAEHKKSYLQIQDEYTDSIYNNITKMKKLFQGESFERRLEDFMFTYIGKIADESHEFIKQLNDDMKKVINLVDTNTNATFGIATKYLQPVGHDQQSLTKNISGVIEEN